MLNKPIIPFDSKHWICYPRLVKKDNSVIYKSCLYFFILILIILKGKNYLKSKQTTSQLNNIEYLKLLMPHYSSRGFLQAMESIYEPYLFFVYIFLYYFDSCVINPTPLACPSSLHTILLLLIPANTNYYY